MATAAEAALFSSHAILVRLNDGVLIPLHQLVGEEVVAVESPNREPLHGIVTHYKYRYCRTDCTTKKVAVYFYVPSRGRRTWRYPCNLRLAYNDGRYNYIQRIFDDE